MSIQLLVGLGNPGPAYDGSRHNAGFDWVDAAARQLGVSLAFDRSHQAEIGRLHRPEAPLWLLKPMTFMNLSGRSVAPLARFFRIPPERILVVHDELDLPPGQVKLKQGGGAAGHNGLKDITAQLGSQDFWRLRLGIGHPGVRHEVADFVLRRPPLQERIAMELAIERSLKALPALLQGAMDKALAEVHAKPPRPPKPRPQAQPAAGPALQPPPAKEAG